MYSVHSMLKPLYSQSRALLIGIDEYKKAGNLSYAVSDALGVKECLIKELGFEKSSIKVLTNEKATKQNILKEYARFSSSDIGVDDRIIVFFAGHGHTLSGWKKETGFLLPHDADPNDFSSMIEWGELTSKGDLIRAKHILFIMDACYGGLAVTRSVGGATRFLEDLLRRPSRQVLTAGKPDETVADSGGPKKGHSIFTGHLLEGLEGKAADENGIITANGVMNYVYHKVGKAPHSQQTPHYGQIDGDGDLILLAPNLFSSDYNCEVATKTMLSMPTVPSVPYEESLSDKVKEVKRLIPDSTANILLNDLMMQETKQFLKTTSEDYFQVSGNVSHTEIVEQIERYQDLTKNLWVLTSVLTRWGREEHLSILRDILARSCDRLTSTSGLVTLLKLKWYPLWLLLYSAGISALSSENYRMLRVLFDTEVYIDDTQSNALTTVESCSKNLDMSFRKDVFKLLFPDTNYYFPFSEHMYSLLQPSLEDTHFVGKNYEVLFDRFEMILFLSGKYYAKQVGGYSAFFGRFAYKETRGYREPLTRLIGEAELLKDNWAPIKGGLFGGSYEGFSSIAQEALEQVRGLNLF